MLIPHTTKTGLSIWDTALCLSKFIEYQQKRNSKYNVANKLYPSIRNLSSSKSINRILELGSGRGLVGITACLLDARKVVLTDVPEIVASLKEIVHELNGLKNAIVTALDWTSVEDRARAKDLASSEKIDIILAADVIWVDELINGLVDTIGYFLDEKTIMLLGFQLRSERSRELLFRQLARKGMRVEEVDQGEFDPGFRKSNIYIFEISKNR